MLTRPGLLLQNSKKKLISFSEAREQVALRHALNLPDVVIEMSKVKVAEAKDAALDIPGHGTYCMTDWARKQLGAVLGVQWDKWFDPKYVDTRSVQDEVQKRFTGSGASHKLRLCRFNGSGAEADLRGRGYDGYVRAVLGPNYASIDDERVFDRMEKSYKSQLSGVNFMKNHLSAAGHWNNDHCSYYSMIGEPVNLGPIDRNSPSLDVRKVYDLAEREGRLPDADWVYPGMQLRNSEVGYTALQIAEFVFRLVCLNGAIVCIGKEQLMYRTHRPTEDKLLDKQLGDAFTKLPEKWKRTETNMKLLSAIPIKEDPNEEIEKQLGKMDATKEFIERAKGSYLLEPLATMYGILQAITRAAQSYEDMDKRFELESLGGRLIANAPKLLAAA